MFGLHPMIPISALTFAGAIACLSVACLSARGLKRGLLLAMALVLLAPSALVLASLKPELVDARFRAYKHLYRDIQVGMTRADVMRLVDRHYPPAGKRLRPKVMEDSATRLGLFMNPEHSTEPNCEGIFLKMREDMVEKKSYSPD